MTGWQKGGDEDDDMDLGDWTLTSVRGSNQSRNPLRLCEDLRASKKINFEGNTSAKMTEWFGGR